MNLLLTLDGIFVGYDVSADGLGAVNIFQPLVMIIGALYEPCD